MRKDAHTFVGGLEAAEQVLKIAVLEEGGLLEDVRSLKHLALLDLDLVAVEIGGDERQYLKCGVGQLEDDIGEDVVVAQANDTLQESLELLEVLSRLVPLVLLQLSLGLGQLVVVDCPEAVEHLLRHVEVALAVLRQRGLQGTLEELQSELQLKRFHGH